jgi:hypothetical protein
MLAPIGEHVDECVTDLTGRAQGACVVSIGPHPPASPEHTIDGPRNANGETLHAAPEVRRPFRLDEQMHMIHLDTEMKNAELVVGRHGQRMPDGAEEPRST